MTRQHHPGTIPALRDYPTALARKLAHRGTSYMSQLSTGRRDIGEKVARQIENRPRSIIGFVPMGLRQGLARQPRVRHRVPWRSDE